jgi:Pyridoxamine 5'-phosphate oxidase
MRWRDFQERESEIALAGVQRFQRARLALLGTLQLDGWPRISPVEPLFISEDLVLGMIWKSKKALDLLRDPRCVLHSVVTDPDANEGELKLRGRAIPVSEGQYVEFIRAKWQLGLGAPLHVFWIDILSASLTTYDFNQGLMLVKRWHNEGGSSEARRAYP